MGSKTRETADHSLPYIFPELVDGPIRVFNTMLSGTLQGRSAKIRVPMINRSHAAGKR
jgi:hypothetical protein